MRTIHKLLIALLLTGQAAAPPQAQSPTTPDTPNTSATADSPATSTEATPTTSPLRHPIHRLSVDVRPAYLAPTNPFFKRNNSGRQNMNTFLSGHLKYGIQFDPDSRLGKLYPHTTQGIGLSVNTLFNHTEIGTPVALYAFQSSRITRITPRLSLDYEWNFGASFGWKKYDEELNPYNLVTGSRINAYINLGIFLNWQLSPYWNLTAGVEGSHFSNGNSHYPNSGVNTLGARIGITRNFGHLPTLAKAEAALPPAVLPFRPHISYDLTLYGGTKIRGWMNEYGGSTLVPGSFGVAGINFNPMYNFHRLLRAGLSLDAQYDESANLQDHHAGTDEDGKPRFYRPSFKEQFNAGLSARFELVMPVFSINIGVGYHLLHKGKDTKGWYQVLALKTSLTRNLYLHTGYQLQNFHDPNHLMLGLGWRFNNRR